MRLALRFRLHVGPLAGLLCTAATAADADAADSVKASNTIMAATPPGTAAQAYARCRVRTIDCVSFNQQAATR
jgi:hypothetical protein